MAGAVTVRMGELAGLLTMSVLGLGGVLALVRLCGDPSGDEEAHRRLFRWTLIAFGAHLAFGFAVTQSAALTNYLGPDAVTYHSIAEAIANHWSRGTGMPLLTSGKEGFFYLLAGLYWVFGPHMAAGMALNAALGASLVPLVTDTTRRLFGAEAARRVAPLMLLLPGLFLWTSQLLKEAPVLFLIAVACNCAVRLSDRLTLAPMLLMVTSIALLLSFRGPIGLVLGVGVIAGLIVGRRELAHGVAAGVVVVGLMGAFVLIGGVGQAGYEQAVTSNLEDASRTRQSLAGAADSGFGADIDTSTSGRALLYLPVGLFNFTLGPFPWQGGAARQLAALPDVVVWWWLLPALWEGYREGRRRIGRRVLTVVLPALTTWLLLAMVISNFGIVSREREQVVVLVAPLLALGLTRRAARRADALAERQPVITRPPIPAPARGA
jgi:4-amino-4-deoxy-L-arabinose transferase-like glycosyltransferase